MAAVIHKQRLLGSLDEIPEAYKQKFRTKSLALPTSIFPLLTLALCFCLCNLIPFILCGIELIKPRRSNHSKTIIFVVHKTITSKCELIYPYCINVKTTIISHDLKNSISIFVLKALSISINMRSSSEACQKSSNNILPATKIRSTVDRSNDRMGPDLLDTHPFLSLYSLA
uniref:G_PROTEIN_RECEP_F1_2 domain-containing protein n=1 Tax=Heterorhabditis bacteriophora TaxID=37862 RepID=A0A1I7WWK9_HETBA